MNTHDLSLDNSDKSKMIKNLHTVLPRISISILSLTLFIKAVNSANLACLVISSQNSDVGGVFNFQHKQELECFNGVESAIHVIAHEDVACVGNSTAFIEQFE